MNPAISVRRALSDARNAASATVARRPAMVSAFQSSELSPERWVCASMNPGSNVASPRSTIAAPGGIGTFGPADVIRVPSTMTTALATVVSWTPSNSRAARIAVTAAGAGDCATTDTLRTAATRNDRIIISIPLFRVPGLEARQFTRNVFRLGAYLAVGEQRCFVIFNG